MKKLLLLLLFSVSPSASALTIVADCTDWYMKQADGALEFRCRTGKTEPWLRLGGCVNATATRNRTTGYVTVTCGEGGTCAGQKFVIRSK